MRAAFVRVACMHRLKISDRIKKKNNFEMYICLQNIKCGHVDFIMNEIHTRCIVCGWKNVFKTWGSHYIFNCIFVGHFFYKFENVNHCSKMLIYV